MSGLTDDGARGDINDGGIIEMGNLHTHSTPLRQGGTDVGVHTVSVDETTPGLTTQDGTNLGSENQDLLSTSIQGVVSRTDEFRPASLVNQEALAAGKESAKKLLKGVGGLIQDRLQTPKGKVIVKAINDNPKGKFLVDKMNKKFKAWGVDSFKYEPTSPAATIDTGSLKTTGDITSGVDDTTERKESGAQTTDSKKSGPDGSMRDLYENEVERTHFFAKLLTEPQGTQDVDHASMGELGDMINQEIGSTGSGNSIFAGRPKQDSAGSTSSEGLVTPTHRRADETATETQVKSLFGENQQSPSWDISNVSSGMTGSWSGSNKSAGISREATTPVSNLATRMGAPQPVDPREVGLTMEDQVENVKVLLKKIDGPVPTSGPKPSPMKTSPAKSIPSPEKSASETALLKFGLQKMSVTPSDFLWCRPIFFSVGGYEDKTGPLSRVQGDSWLPLERILSPL